MLYVLCVLFSFCAVPLNTTAPCRRWEVNGKVYWILIIELKDPHSGWSRRGTAQGGEGVWWVGVLTISQIFIKYISLYKRDQINVHINIYFVNMITRKKWKTWECEAKKNIHIYSYRFCLIHWPWKSKLPPFGEAREWWNLGTLEPEEMEGPPPKKCIFASQVDGISSHKNWLVMNKFYWGHLNGNGVTYD